MSPHRGLGPSAVTAGLRRALQTADWQFLVDVLHPDVYWGPLARGARGCRGRSRVLSRCTRLYARAPRIAIEETFTYPAAVVLGLQIHGTESMRGPVYQVCDVADGLVTRIAGYTDRARALEAAYHGSAVDS